MKFCAAAILFLSAAVLSAPISAKKDREPIVLEPSSNWELDYATDSCALRRMFGDKEHAQIELRQFSPESEMQVTILADGWKTTGRSPHFRFEPSGEWQDVSAPIYATVGENFEGVIFSADILVEPEKTTDEAPEGIVDPQEEAARAKAFAEALGFSIKGAFKEDFTMNAGSLLAPYQAMQGCLDELLNHWGIDAPAQRSLTRRAVPSDLKALAGDLQRDYPKEMLRKGMPGTVHVRLTVDETGRVSDCHIQASISEPDFEKTACSHLRDGEFEPALDKDGKPIASYWTTGITYTIR